jgi:hypothetical protein
MSLVGITKNLVTKTFNKAVQTGQKCINKFGKVPATIGLISGPSITTACLTSGDEILGAIGMLPGSTTFSIFATAAVAKGVTKLPQAIKYTKKQTAKAINSIFKP